MLSWSESDVHFKPDYRLAIAFEQQISDAEFEVEISRLIERAYDRDVAMKVRYREARAKLAEGDHYILVMIDRALGLRVSGTRLRNTLGETSWASCSCSLTARGGCNSASRRSARRFRTELKQL